MAVGDKLFGAEGRWLMGRVMPRQFLDTVEKYLHHFAPDREDEVMAAINARAEELVEEDKEMATDGPAKGALAICAVVLASFEQLVPLFDGDERRAILLLQHAMGGVLERPYELMFGTLSERDDALDKLDKACTKMKAIYPAYFEWEFGRPDPGTFEMKVHRCFFHDFFSRHDAEIVTTVMCAFDVSFMQAIDPAVSGLRAERTSLLSLGDDECTFTVLETDDPLAEYTDKLDQRFTGAQE
ncbi:MAG TPA: L-2-amino-thiazoline-4-carboxylic acid hydrolase [Solirubrobacterales bacterium]|nr:L-2-amino-thiazoline-4-carboxylic acid hydrolase [Solirubrobacterales bacterium]